MIERTGVHPDAARPHGPGLFQGPRQQGGPESAPQIGGMRRPSGAGARGYPSSPGMTTPQGGTYRGDFDGN